MAVKCPFCKGNKQLPVSKKNIAEHLIITKDNDNHFHIHGPISNRALIQDMVVYVLREVGIAYSVEADGRQPQGRVVTPGEGAGGKIIPARR